MTGWLSRLVARWRELREQKQLLRLVRNHVAALHAETGRREDTWHCLSCTHQGDPPDMATLSLELYGNALWRTHDCPACGWHSCVLGGEQPLPAPADYPLPDYGSCGPCPSCGSEDTVPIMYGMPSQEGFLAANRGRVRLGGCIVIEGLSPDASCTACGVKWVREGPA